MARRDDREYREYSREEQRRHPGCPARKPILDQRRQATRLRILYLADIRFPLERANGIQTMETCCALARRGLDVTLLVRRDRHRPARDPFEFYGLEPPPSLQVVHATSVVPTVRRAAYMGSALIRIATAGKDSLVLTRDLGVASAVTSLPGSTRPALVYESHGFAPTVSADLPSLITGGPSASAAKLRRLARRERQVWSRAEGYVTITRALAEDLQRRFGARQVAVIPDGVRLREGEEASVTSGAGAQGVIAYAGHLYPWKGVDTLVEALALIPEVRGLIIGGHPDEADLSRVRHRVELLGLAERITLTGLVPPSSVHQLLRDADILVLPNTATTISRDYSSPLKLFEYMAARRPIIASDLASFREVLTDEDALFVEPGDPAALSAAIRTLLNDRQRAAALAARSFGRVRDYTWDRRAVRLEPVLTAALRFHERRGVLR